MSAEIDWEGLIVVAREVARHAYVPYSRFPVGAALLGGGGEIYPGCNVENASFGLALCAERVAVFRAVSSGERAFRALALCVPDGGTPCGGCRQVLHEFAPELPITIFDPGRDRLTAYHLDELLPYPFNL